MAIFIIDDWACVKQASMPLSLGISGGWSNPLAEALIPLEPSEVIIGGWKRISSITVNLISPIMECSTDTDCPEGYVCVGGICVKKEGFPWVPIAIGSAAVAGVILIASGMRKETK